MNYKFLKTATLSISALFMLLMSGCVKEKTSSFTDFSQVSDFVALTNGPQGGNTTKVSFNRGTDLTMTITADLASANSSNGAVNVTIGVDPAALAAYNTANGTNFVALPTANYKLNATSLTIPAGQHYASTTLSITNTGALDPAVSYMIPVSIIDASGKKLSSNLNTLYYYTIGNPLAGVYNWLGQRWNSPNLDTTKAPATTPFNNVSQALSPIGPTTLFLQDAYLSQNLGVGVTGYALSFTNTGGTLSNFQLSLYDPQGGLPALGFSVIGGPVLVGYNIVGTAATKYIGSTFRVWASFDNGAGGQRSTINTFTKTQ